MALAVTMLAAGAAARRLRIASPVALLAGGALLGFVPALRGVELPPEAVLLLFLPALLFWESLTISLRGIRQNLRGIVLNSTLLVVVTAAVVAVVAHALGLSWGAAWVLGAAVAPTDATAVGVLSRLLPRRDVTILRAESLVNDGTALVVYGVAVGVTTGEQHLSAAGVSGQLALSYGGGLAAGLALSWAVGRVQRRLDDPMQENLLALLGPFAAYLLAEEIGASGVLAVVVYGLVRGQVAPRQMQADTRQQGQAFWSLSAYLLNGALFVLVGLEMQTVVRGLTSASLARGLLAVVLVAFAVVATRFAWLFTVPYVIRLLDRRPQQRARRRTARARAVSATAGFRGGVSLALALAVPQTVSSGAAFPDRDLVVFITAGVIVVTLAQGLVLPGVVRWARLSADASDRDERRLAESTTSQAALDALAEVADELGTAPPVVARTHRELEDHLAALAAADDPDDDSPAEHGRQYASLRLALLARKRAALVELRDERRIDDDVLRQVQTQLDLEEVRLTRRTED